MSIEIRDLVAELEANIAQVVLGKPQAVRLSVVTLLAGEHLLLADTPDELAAGALLVLRERTFAQRLAAAAYALTLERYSWERIVSLLEDAHTLALGRFEQQAG